MSGRRRCERGSADRADLSAASYWSATSGNRVFPDIAWTYEKPLHDAARVRGLIAFFGERIDVVLDGERLKRPITPRSAGSGA